MALADIAAGAALLVLFGLALYLFFKYDDGKAALASVVAAALVVATWHLGLSRQSDLARELSSANDDIALRGTKSAERGFDPEVRELMVRRLRDFVGPTAFVVANSSDPETVSYARQIVTVLKDAGWEVPPSFGMTYQPIVLPGHDSAMPGVVLGITADVPSDFSSSVLRVLREGGIDVVEGPHWPGTEHPVSILVGPKREH